MSVNKQVVEEYMRAFSRGDRAAVLACLTDDVEWELPGTFHLSGKVAFEAEMGNPGFTGLPDITTSRLVEEHDVVVAEGMVNTRQADGEPLTLRYCDVFVMRGGLIRSLTSYLMVLPHADQLGRD